MAQVKALGGGSRLAWSIASSFLGDSFEDEDFWVTVIHFFVNNQPMLALSYVGPIIDYIRYHKYVPQQLPQPDGTVVEGPPPHPNFSMKGRSAAKLVRFVDDWHAQLTGEEDIPLKKWEPSGFRQFSHTEIDSETGCTFTWSIHELCTSVQLDVEGRAMRHCVASYVNYCMSGETSIWSLRVRDVDTEDSEQCHILTLAVDNRKRTITQARASTIWSHSVKLVSASSAGRDVPTSVFCGNLCVLCVFGEKERG
jgi:hypothetical protein